MSKGTTNKPKDEKRYFVRVPDSQNKSEKMLAKIALQMLTKSTDSQVILLRAVAKLNTILVNRLVHQPHYSLSRSNECIPRVTTTYSRCELQCRETSTLQKHDFSPSRSKRKTTTESDESDSDDSEDSDDDEEEVEDDDDEDDDEIEFPPETDKRFPKSYTDKIVYGVRADQVIAGCLANRSAVVKMFLGGKLRINNRTLLKKATGVKGDDILDIVHMNEDKKLLVSTVKVLKVTKEKTRTGKPKVAVRYWKKPYYIDKISKS